VEKIAAALVKRQARLAVAESCTGGLLAKVLTDQAGSSMWFECGWVTYSNAGKQRLLGVSPSILAQLSAVSEAVALAMAEGALTHSCAQFSVAITGLAGPGGGKLEQPVGTICFAWASKKFNSRTTMHLFSGDRMTIRTLAVHFALQELDRLLYHEWLQSTVLSSSE
jgi:nicotinamide-nucleotide amidase